jgi:hypothetical protein
VEFVHSKFVVHCCLETKLCSKEKNIDFETIENVDKNFTWMFKKIVYIQFFNLPIMLQKFIGLLVFKIFLSY